MNLLFLTAPSFESRPSAPSVGSILGNVKSATGIAKDIQDLWYRGKEFGLQREELDLKKAQAKQQMRSVDEERERKKQIRNYLLRGNY